MALTDIISRIQHDAQKQVQDVLAQAQTQARERVAHCTAELQKKSRQAADKRKELLAASAAQQAQMTAFASEQKLLAAKRDALAQLQADLIAQALADRQLREKIYAYILRRLPENIERIRVAADDVALVTPLLKKYSLSAAIEGSGDSGVCVAYQHKAVIDCSLSVVIADIVQTYEGRLARELFGA